MTSEEQDIPSKRQENLILLDSFTDPQKKVLKHLSLYPILVSTKDFAYNLPYVEKSSTKTLGIYLKVRQATPLNNLLDKGDLLIDSVLGRVDKVVPSLKTTNYEDIKKQAVAPVNQTIHESQRLATNANNAFQKKIYDPTSSSLKSAHLQAKSIYDDKAKGKVDKRTNFIFGPVNSHLEKYVLKSFPNIKIPNAEGASELSRSIQLLHNLIRRTPKEEREQEQQEPQGENISSEVEKK